MSKKRDYIPAKNKDFFDWQDNLVARVVLNMATWLIDAARVAVLTAAQGVYVPLYNAIKTKQGRTPQQVDAHKQGRKTYTKVIRTFVKENLIGNTAIPHDDKVGLGLNPGDGTAGSRPAIETSPHTTMKSLGGGVMKFENRVEGDSTKPSRHKDSDGLEMRYAILPYKGTGGITPPPGPGEPPGGELPTPEQCPFVHFSTKATFKLDFGVGGTGKVIVGYTRWKNNTDATKSGPYITIPVGGLIA